MQDARKAPVGAKWNSRSHRGERCRGANAGRVLKQLPPDLLERVAQGTQLELLPSLRPGVAVHLHDVFTPWHYPQRWLVDDQWLWNEQYVLEAFLSCNDSFRILGALHWLSRRHADEFRRGFPVYAAQEHPWVPGSFWIERVR